MSASVSNLVASNLNISADFFDLDSRACKKEEHQHQVQISDSASTLHLISPRNKTAIPFHFCHTT